MFLGAVLIDALHAALENAVVALKGVRVGIAPDILATAVCDELMAGENGAELRVLPSLIRHDGGFLGNVGAKDRHKVGGGRAVDVEGPDHAASLDKGQDRVLVRIATADRHAVLLTNESLVDFNDFACPAKGHELAMAHSLTQPVRHEPSRFVGDAENAMDLVAAHALLAAAKKVSGLKPEMELDVAGLEHRLDRGRKLLLAVAAATKADPTTLHKCNPIQAAAMRTDGAFRPNQAFKLGISGGFVVKELGGKCGTGHGVTP